MKNFFAIYALYLLTYFLISQKNEANRLFSKFIENNYEDWLNNNDIMPLFSNNIIKDKLVNELSYSTPTLFIVIDNLRYDQWRVIEPLILEPVSNSIVEAIGSLLLILLEFNRFFSCSRAFSFS